MTEIDYDGLASDTAALDGLNRGVVAEFRANGGEVSGLPGGRLLCRTPRAPSRVSPA
ncbi:MULTISPECIES: hypothetical protein [unclassified Nocardia]|uniref:hypothetical protein n=1 Tax=Nocardia sp. NPDC019255 TaxID=3154591 RepID=UPI00340F44C4